NLVLLAEPLHQLQQLAGEGAVLVAGAIPELFEVVQLLLAHRLLKRLADARRRLHALGLIVEIVVGLVLDLPGFVSLKNTAFALLEHGDKGFETGAEAADLAGVNADGAGQLLLGQAARVAVEEQVLECGRDHVRRRDVRPWQVDRVVLLVGVDDPAQRIAAAHRGSLLCCPFSEVQSHKGPHSPSSLSVRAPTAGGAPARRSGARLSLGNAVPAGMLPGPASIIVTRSRPRAIPPCGGAPWLSAFSRKPKRCLASASLMPSTAKTRCCTPGSWIRMLPPPTS